AVIGMDAARADDAVQVHPRGDRNPPNISEGSLVPAPWHGNVRGPSSAFSLRRRRARRSIEHARRRGDPLLIDGVFQTAAQQHTTLEPHAAVARFTGETLELHVSTQAVAELARLVAKEFELPVDKVRVAAEHVGGGFGAKLGLGVETRAAILLARQAEAPVRVMFDRLEELSVAGYRPSARIETSLLTDSDANLKAVRMAAFADTGVGVGSTIAGLSRLIYPARAKELLDYDVVSHMPPGSPFRGPGGPLACFALEQAVDEAARTLSRDPIVLRQRWDPDPGRQRLYRWAAGLPVWQTREELSRTGRFRQGVGVAAATWLYFWESNCAVAVELTAAGRLLVSTAVQDMGTGSRSVLAATVAARFGLSPADVDVRLGDSSLPRGPKSSGSRTTATIVPAAGAAAMKLAAKLAVEVGTHRGLIDPRPTGDGVRHRGGLLPWAEVLAEAAGAGAAGARVVAGRPGDDRRLARAATRALAGAGVAGAGYGVLLRLTGALNTGRGYAGAVHVAEVEVDTRLGRTRVLRVHGGLTVGRPAVPELAAAQARGSIIQGVGYALYEERQVDPQTGLILTAGLEDYRIPGIADIPEIDLHFDPDGFDHVPGGGIGMGEVATLPVAAAIANAVRDATGVRPYELPISPDRLLDGLATRDAQ
ncbi:MAG: molybdopterin-dependent oxidoreductase, partial [Actinomycetota bacterium]|nr:molybdopterin-dependent oxidoreductase [Actinomycetota bacterium]